MARKRHESEVGLLDEEMEESLTETPRPARWSLFNNRNSYVSMEVDEEDTVEETGDSLKPPRPSPWSKLRKSFVEEDKPENPLEKQLATEARPATTNPWAKLRTSYVSEPKPNAQPQVENPPPEVPKPITPAAGAGWAKLRNRASNVPPATAEGTRPESKWAAVKNPLDEPAANSTSNETPRPATKWGVLKKQTSGILIDVSTPPPKVKLRDKRLLAVAGGATDDEKQVSRMSKVVTVATTTHAASNKFKAGQQMRVKLKERMRKIVQERLTVRQIFKRYVESSTLHGFCYVCSDTFFIRRFIWAVLMILGAIYFIIKLRYGIEEYLEYEFSTLSTVHYNLKTLPFPAISFCTVNSFLSEGLSTSNISRLQDDGRLPLIRNWSIPAYDIPGCVLYDELEANSLKIDKLLVDCEYIAADAANPNIPANDCGSHNFTNYFNYRGEVCHTVNPGTDNHHLLHVNGEGITKGYRFNIDLQSYKTLSTSDFNGLKIVIHNQKKPPHLSDGFIVPAGSMQYIKMSYREDNSLPAPYSTNCGEKELKYFEEYTQHRCLLEELTEFTAQRCSCRDFFMPDNGLPLCSLKQLYSCMYHARESFSNIEARERCPIDCTEFSYSYEVSDSRFLHNTPTGIDLPSDASYIMNLKARFNQSNEEINMYIEDNIVSVIFFFDDMKKEITEQEPSFDFFQFLGDMGGEFGLMLGASLLTFVEFIDLFIFLIYHQLLRFQNLKNTPDVYSTKNEDEDVAV